MQMTSLDWFVVAASLLIAFSPALFFARRAGKGVSEFFTSGQAAPWWLVGVSLVATTFATDTPNFVTNLVREQGVSANWEWWAFLLTGMTTVFFYARLWRRSGVLTDLEFYEIRYSGRSAAFVRGFRAIYLGLLFNGIIMANVTLAAVKIANILLGWSMIQTIVICSIFNVVFASIAGLWGVMVVDMIQFVIAMTGSFAAAYFALSHPAVGGLENLVKQVDPSLRNMVPDPTNWPLMLKVMILPLAVQWWAAWYPGSEPGGGSYVAQRMLASKDEQNSVAATLFFNVLHYGLRTWPWLIVALASILVYPRLEDIQAAFPHLDPALVRHDIAYPAMLKFLPPGYLGLMIASLLAAYVSTMVTHLNWGGSYLVHDFYQRFLAPGRSDRHYVLVSRLSGLFLMIYAAGVTLLMESARQGFDVLISIGAGTGLIYLLRWFWWRVNAWSEIAAMLSSFAVSLWFFLHPLSDALSASQAAEAQATRLLITVGLTTAAWLIATFITPRTDEATLVSFYRRTKPMGPGWAAIRERHQLPRSTDSPALALVGVIAGCLMIYSAMFAVGRFLFGNWFLGTIHSILFVVGALTIAWVLPRMFASATDDPGVG